MTTASLSMKVPLEVKQQLQQVAAHRNISVHRLMIELLTDCVQVCLQDIEYEKQTEVIVMEQSTRFHRGELQTVSLAESKRRSRATLHERAQALGLL